MNPKLNDLKIKDAITDEEIKKAMADSKSIELTLNGQIEPIRAILKNHLGKLNLAPM